MLRSTRASLFWFRAPIPRIAVVSPFPDRIRIAILEEAAAPGRSLVEPLTRAAKVVGVEAQLEVLISPDTSESFNLDLMVLSQQTPAEFTPDIYRSWRCRFPLARLVTVWGPWCIGGHRQGFPHSETIYVSWLSWPWQVQCFLRQLYRAEPTLWDLPSTRSTTDRLAKAVDAFDSSGGPGVASAIERRTLGTLEVVASAAGLGSALPQALGTLGLKARVWHDVGELARLPITERGSIWIWEPDVPRLSTSEIVRMREQLPGAGIILLGFAEILGRTRQNDGCHDLSHRLSQAGPTILLPKPFLVSELQAAVSDLSFQDCRRANGF